MVFFSNSEGWNRNLSEVTIMRVQFCGVCKNLTDRYLINSKWICSACACKFDFEKRRFVPSTDEEFEMLIEQLEREDEEWKLSRKLTVT